MQKIVVTCPVVWHDNRCVVGNAKIQGCAHKELMLLVGVLANTLTRNLMMIGGKGVLKATYSLELGLSLDLRKYDLPQTAARRKRIQRAAQQLNGYKINNIQIKGGDTIKLERVLINITFFVG